MMTHATGAPLFFSRVPRFKVPRPLQKLIWIKPDLLPDEQSIPRGLRFTTNIVQKKSEIPRRFGVKKPRHSETVFAKKRYTLS